MIVARAAAGAVVGAIAGAGFRLTWWRWLPEQCGDVDGPGCFVGLMLMLPLFVAGWAIVASTVLFWVLELGRQPGAWSAAGLGCGLWPVLVWATALFASLGSGGWAEILMPVVAYALAGALTGRSRSSAHGEVTRESP